MGHHAPNTPEPLPASDLCPAKSFFFQMQLPAMWEGVEQSYKPAQIQLDQALLCEMLHRVHSGSHWDKSKGSGTGWACRRNTQ